MEVKYPLCRLQTQVGELVGLPAIAKVIEGCQVPSYVDAKWMVSWEEDTGQNCNPFDDINGLVFGGKVDAKLQKVLGVGVRNGVVA